MSTRQQCLHKPVSMLAVLETDLCTTNSCSFNFYFYWREACQDASTRLLHFKTMLNARQAQSSLFTVDCTISNKLGLPRGTEDSSVHRRRSFKLQPLFPHGAIVVVFACLFVQYSVTYYNKKCAEAIFKQTTRLNSKTGQLPCTPLCNSLRFPCQIKRRRPSEELCSGSPADN